MAQPKSTSPEKSTELPQSLRGEGACDHATEDAHSCTHTIVKRDGMIVPFQRGRISLALESAFRDTRGIGKVEALPKDVEKTIGIITDQVVRKLFQLAHTHISLNVEEIQDVVEVTLMENGYHDVARDYIIYRDSHKALRESDPRNLKIIRKHDQPPVHFNPFKVTASIAQAIKIRDHIDGATPEKIVSIVNTLSREVTQKVIQLATTTTPSTEHIQNFIEESLMEGGFFQAAKEYILHRFTKDGGNSYITTQDPPLPLKGADECVFEFKTAKGEKGYVSKAKLLERLVRACSGFEQVASAQELLEGTILNFYEDMQESEVDQALLMAAKAKIEKDPAYSKIAARLLLDKIYMETMAVDTLHPQLENRCREHFERYISYGIEIKRLTPKLAGFDIKRLGEALVPSRDDLFQFMGLQTLYDRYFVQDGARRIETPQFFWMRVAMGLSLNEKDKTACAIEFYHLFSQLHYLPATPTLFNAGTSHPQLSSCYLSTISDSLEHIFKTIGDNAQLSKRAGGIGNDWTNVRGSGAHIRGTNGLSQGVIPFLKIANDTAIAVNQGGKRKGVACAYLEIWHIDIEDFLELRKNTGDERRRTHDMNIANWIPDLFMKRVQRDGPWTLFSPDEVPDLHHLYGKAFERRYVECEKLAEKGVIKLCKVLEASCLWRKMLSMLFETGHPWLTFKDPCNIRSPQDHKGVVCSSNLCTEITLNSSEEETAVCNLGSINLAKHVVEGGGIDEGKLSNTIEMAIRTLDNVIDINLYPIPEARTANINHRAVGLGIMGFQDALHIQKMSYASYEAVQFADVSMEMISYYAILHSSRLAKERGPYPTYGGSKWDRGLLPIDTIDLLESERGESVTMDRSTSMEWGRVRESVRRYGMRNSNVMAIAPTATITNIAGASQSIEPNYKNLYVKSNLSGDFIVHNLYLVADLKALSLWDDQMIDALKYFDGSILEIERIPEEIKRRYLTAFQIDPEWNIECASRRQKWIDQAQSLNLYLDEPSGKKLHNMYMLGWKKGLKTCYYLRSRSATQIEKSTMDINRWGVQPRWMKHTSPSSRVVIDREVPPPDQVPACSLGEGCESCQ